MILSDLGISMASLILVLAGWMGHLSTELILLVLLLRSVGTAFHSPCIQAVTPQIVPKDQLTRCAGYSQTLQSVCEIFSPALAAVLFIGEVKEGFQILKEKKGILGLVLVSALFTLALMPTSALFPLMSMSYFRGKSTQASITEMAFSIGLLVGSLILSAWGGTKNRIYPIIGAYVLISVSLIGSGLLAPDRFWIFVIFSWLICAPVGLSVSGILAEIFGVENWFIIAGVILLIAAVLCVLIPEIRNCDKKSEGARNA